MVVQQERWLQALAAAVAVDEQAPPGTVRHSEASRFIAASQPDAGAWLDIFPDGTSATRIESIHFEIGLELRGSLRIASAADAFDSLAARGQYDQEVGDTALLSIRKGARLLNGGEYNRSHHAVVHAVYKMVAAVATGS